MRFKYLFMFLLLISMLSIYGVVFAQWEDYTGEKPNKELPKEKTGEELKKNETTVSDAEINTAANPKHLPSAQTTAKLQSYDATTIKNLSLNGTPSENSHILLHNHKLYIPITPVVKALGDKIQVKEDHIQITKADHTKYSFHKNGLVIVQEGDKVVSSSKVKSAASLFKDNQPYLSLAAVKEILPYPVTVKGGLINIGDEIKPTSDFPLDVPLLNQMDPPRLYNGCEVTSMAMILNYFDIAVTKNELAEKVNRVPLVYSNGLRGNPNEGFVGDMEDGPGLSIYHGPLAEATRSYVGDRLIDFTGSGPEKLFHYLDQGLPVWVIVTSTFGPVNSFRPWDTPSGEIEITFDLHSVVLTGYDKNNFYINNPYGFKNQKVNKEQFIKGWKQLGSQAIVITM
ncbi:C39 family peptidase [Halobacillus naozhouensis]|uniref:C39 family peptidase n=1 Tax=Halobacillus naozhouensis TaxID=554880 RepID=A0ABY8IZS4_9BACI|nr:C39 family peptidase [Halobacillus naozhouensis]WFT75738.1 C39 family peptidase [Halobacillus naozhouensis]